MRDKSSKVSMKIAQKMPVRLATVWATAWATALATTLTACIPASPRLDASYGVAVSMAIIQQTANPNAYRNIDPISGIDAQAGDASMDNYRESFVNPRPALSGGVVNVGSGRAGSGGGGSGGAGGR